MTLTVYCMCQQQSVSPELLECRNLELAVPGTYRAGISEFFKKRLLMLNMPASKFYIGFQISRFSGCYNCIICNPASRHNF